MIQKIKHVIQIPHYQCLICYSDLVGVIIKVGTSYNAYEDFVIFKHPLDAGDCEDSAKILEIPLKCFIYET